MARETLRDFLTSIGSGADSVSYTVRDDSGDGSIGTGDDLGIDPNTGKELVNMATDEGLLGDYLNFIQENEDVVFNVSPGNTRAATSNRGDSLPPPENQGAESVFVEYAGGSQASVSLSQYSNSGKFDQDATSLSEIIDKTGQTDSHHLLHQIKGKPVSTAGELHVKDIKKFTGPTAKQEKNLVNASVNILKNHNRFSPAGSTLGDAFVERGKQDDEFSTDPAFTVQREFGKYDETFMSSIESLSEIGESLLRASSQILSTNIDDDSFPEKILTGIDPVNKIVPSDIRAKNSDGFPELLSGDSTRQGRGEFLILSETESSNSYGSMTGKGDAAFDPINKKYLRVRAAASIKTMILAIESFKDIALNSCDNINSKIDSANTPMLMGEHKRYIQFRMSVVMNSMFTPTDRPYKSCVNAGAKFMLGLDKNISEIKDRKNAKGPGTSRLVKNSPGFALALSRSILLSVESLNKILDSEGSSDYDSAENARAILEKISKTRVIGILNSLAIIGDIRLKIKRSRSEDFGMTRSSNPWSVDDLPDGPTTRISKSRTSDGFNVSALSMRTSATPSSFVLPKGVIRAVSRMGMSSTDTNPARLLASPSGKKIFMGEGIKDGGRIPSEVVHRMEDLLDAEYVPFYFHDIRTNEITSFHAFLDSLQDGYTANFTESTGYGRMDAVQTYSNTKRDISFTFTVAATSPEDFDEMWLKINKLTTLVYPQWSLGDVLSSGENTFIQPFSQVLASSPLVRVRIGDIVKSNYSKFNIGRIFGVGYEATNMKLPASGGILGAIGDAIRSGLSILDSLDELFLKAFLVAFGSPLQIQKAFGTNFGSSLPGPAASALIGSATKLLENGFANPFLNVILKKYRDPDNEPSESAASSGNLAARLGNAISSIGDSLDGYAKPNGKNPKNRFFGVRAFVKPSQSKSYRVVAKDGEEYSSIKKIRFNRPVLGIVLGRRFIQTSKSKDRDNRDNDKSRSVTLYRIKLIDFNIPSDLFGAEIEISHSDIVHDPKDTFSRFMMPILNPGAAIGAFAQNLANEGAQALGLDVSGVNIALSDEQRFLSADKNAIIRSFESTRGRGLAGVIKGLKFDWLTENTPWEIDWGSRAPQVCKVTITFAPIHDIPPGIDNEGFNRAPIYNVGKLAQSMAGDAYDDGGQSSKETYEFEHRKNFKNE